MRKFYSLALAAVMTVTAFGASASEATVAGDEGGVQYDIEMIKTIPSLTPFDLQNKTLETLQLYFNGVNLKLDASLSPVVTVKGPNFLRQSALKPNMAMGTVTVFKTSLSDPEYNGTYTLSLPEGVLGDAEWMADHTKGHANAAVNMTFEVIKGKDPSTITEDLTFMPLVTPSGGSTVSDMSDIVFSFDSYPYWEEGVEFELQKLVIMGGSEIKTPSAKAHPERGEGNDVKIVFSKEIKSKGRYFLTVPKGSFWNEGHQTNPDGGALNAEMVLEWQFTPPLPDIQMISHVPATDEHVGVFKMGEPGVVINTTNNGIVDSMNVKIVEYPLDSEDGSGTTIVSSRTYDKTEEGAPCWINRTDADIALNPDCYYECTVKLYQSSTVILEELFEFYGSDTVGVEAVEETVEDARIYTIQGMPVSRPAEELPAGLYIVAGKKVLISK